MIHYIRGKIVFKKEKFVVIENGGIGYKINCSPAVRERMPDQGEIKVLTYLFPKEGSIELYGFLTEEELELFEILNEISGIGPRTALDLSVFGSIEKLKEAMEKGELEHKVKGVGKKKAQKIVLELTGKIKESRPAFDNDLSSEALDALVSLGFPKQRALQALKEIPASFEKTEEKVKEALKILGRR
jgi:Holliday junction DNA helicase RuvA